MTTFQNLAILGLSLTASHLTSAAVPGSINYQGRLTNTSGTPQPGSHAMSLKIYDTATGGTQLYTESLGNITADANGVYSFQFGAGGTSDALITETIATTDGSALIYQKTLSNAPVVANSISVTDGTYSWNQATGNPGSTATATTNIISGFVIGATITSGGSGYTSAPAVTITGNGSGAAATATVSGGAVSGITITSAGSGYTTGATISIASPPAPFIVNYSDGTITATYATAPAAGQTITATYRYSASGISGAIAASSEQWLELTVDGVSQSPRQKVLAVPFAINAQTADYASGLLEKQLNDLSKDVALAAAGLPSPNSFSEKFTTSKLNLINSDTSLTDLGSTYAAIVDTSNNGQALLGNGGPLAQNFDNAYVRGAFIQNIAGYSYPLTFTFTYYDNSVATINGTMTGRNQYIPNPAPDKSVKRVAYSFPSNVQAYLTVRSNKSGDLGILIPASLTIKAKIGLFIGANLATAGDLITAQLVGTSGSQPIAVNGYTNIPTTVGRPQKILVSLSASNSNLEDFSSINGYVVRFSE